MCFVDSWCVFVWCFGLFVVGLGLLVWVMWWLWIWIIGFDLLLGGIGVEGMVSMSGFGEGWLKLVWSECVVGVKCG